MLRLAVVLALVTSCSSDRKSPAAGAAKGAFFALSVADLEASASWYADKLGLDVVTRIAKAPGQVGVTILAGRGLTVELLQLDDAAASGKDAELVHGFFKAGFVVDDLAAALAALKARGVDVFLGPFPAKDRIPANAIIKDNAGNLIQLFEPPA